MKAKVRITINERLYEEEVEPRLLLVTFIRERAGLTGTHVGCEIGECGACTVILDGKLTKSCLILAARADGLALTTVEGIARGDHLHPIQESFIESYGLQCGYCTPGMILATSDLLNKNPDPTEDEIRQALAGNLCMCTGYMQIVKAVQTAAKRLKDG